MITLNSAPCFVCWCVSASKSGVATPMMGTKNNATLEMPKKVWWISHWENAKFITSKQSHDEV